MGRSTLAVVVEDDTGFEEFVLEHLDALCRYATVLSGDPHLAQDIVQDVLIRARDRWAGIEHPKAYLRRMVTNEHTSWRRRRATRAQVYVEPEEISRVAPAGADPSIGVDERAAMATMLRRLPPKQRATLVLRYYEGCSDAEIADALHCSIGTVRSQVSRGLAALRTTEFDRQATARREESR